MGAKDEPAVGSGTAAGGAAPPWPHASASEPEPTAGPAGAGEAAPPAADGSLGDAFSAFVAAVSKPPSAPAPDPQVAVAFALGWQMAELYRPERRQRREPAQPDDLPGVGSFDAGQLTQLGLHQVEAALARLKEPVERGGQDLSMIDQICEALHDLPEEPNRRDLILRLHVQLLSALTAADFRLGKAYGLGRALADTCRNPQSMEDLRREFDSERIATLRGWISDLSSLFPPHAGHTVRESLDRWCQRLAAEPGTAEEHLEDLLSRLRRQGELWRALLSAEKLGRDMLEMSNYVRAAESLIARMRDLALRFISRFRLMIGLIAVLFVGGVVLALAVQDSASTAAGLASIAASLGLSWKGVGGSLGRAIARVERPAWEAQLDIAIADAITLLPEAMLPPPPTPSTWTRLKRLVTGGAPSSAPAPR